MKQWGVWVGEFVDNDTPDWYGDHDEAFDAWHALADGLSDGESAYLQRFDEDGETDEDFAHELRMEGGQVLEYYAGERVWA